MLYDAGIKMWWSTVVYFDRSEFSRMFFDTWAHVADNYEFYQYLYNFSSKLFRTDYCVSIAVHVLTGMVGRDDLFGNFNDTPLINMSQKDDIIEAINDNEWIFIAHDPKEEWKNILVRSSNQDVHVMNKRALGRIKDKVMETIHE